MPGDRDVQAPGFFTWVIDGVLAAHAFPKFPSHFRFLESEGVKKVISLTMNQPVVPDDVDIQLLKIPMIDFTVPTFEQTDEFCQHVLKAKENGEAVSVHCQMGRGRTGTLIACYFVQQCGLTSTEACEKIRAMRPGSIETNEQLQYVSTYEEYLKNKTSDTS